MTAVKRQQRHSRAHRCPVCGGADQDPRGKGRRCSGFTSDDGDWCQCSREEHAGGLSQNDAGLYAHLMRGPCNCGVTHGPGKVVPMRDEIEATYNYHDEHGKLLFQVVRKTGKRFLQRRPAHDGVGWVWNMEGVQRVPYRLPELVAADTERTVWIVEGEKDVHALEQRGELATCNPGGAGKWHMIAEKARRVLGDIEVVVIADADDKGRKHAHQVASALHETAHSVQVVELPQKDVSDYFAAGGDVDGLVSEAESQPLWTPTDQPEREPGDDSDEPAEVRAVDRWGVRTVAQSLQAVYDRCQRPEPVPSCSTGVAQLNQLMGGYRRGMVTVLGARTHWGKSTFTLLATDLALLADKQVLMVSCEDEELMYAKRLAARRSRVWATALRDETVTDDDKRRLLQTVVDAERAPWFIDGRGKSAEVIAKAIEELCAEVDYDLVIVDYVQAIKIAGRVQDRRNEVTEVVRRITDAIKCGGASGILVSQIKRLEGSDNRDPTMHDIKESGDIENAAEHILLGCLRDGDRTIKLAKNKDGPSFGGHISLRWDEHTASFLEVR